MASTSVDFANDGTKRQLHDAEKTAEDRRNEKVDAPIDYDEDRRLSSSTVYYDHTHRMLKPRHIQLIGIGYAINCAIILR